MNNNDNDIQVPCKIGAVGDAKLDQCHKTQSNAECEDSLGTVQGPPDKGINTCRSQFSGIDYVAYNPVTNTMQCCKHGNSKSTTNRAWSMYQLVGDKNAPALTYDCYTDKTKNICVDYREGTGRHKTQIGCQIACSPPGPPSPSPSPGPSPSPNYVLLIIIILSILALGGFISINVFKKSKLKK